MTNMITHVMDHQLAANTIHSVDDQALQASWRRFLDYDAAAAFQKVHHTRIRIAIILLGLTASVLAVASTYVDPAQTTVAGTLRIILIFVPILTAGLVSYAYQFSPSLSWVAYRIGAELVRREIYLYRMFSGDYAGLTPGHQQQLLLTRLNEANKRVNKIGAPDPYLQATIVDIPKAVSGKTNDKADDGFSTLTSEEYIAYRVQPQKDWYIKKARQDYDQMRRWRVYGLAVAAASSAMAALNFAPIVAATTAIGVALATYMELQMYGRTFSIYHPLANQLEIELDKWNILLPGEQANPVYLSAFVKTMEDSFQGEREIWMQQAIQAQQAIEQTLGKNVGTSSSSSTPPTSPDGSQTTVTTSLLDQPDSTTSTVSVQTQNMPAVGNISGDTPLPGPAPTAPTGVTVITTTPKLPADSVSGDADGGDVDGGAAADGTPVQPEVASVKAPRKKKASG
jgi:SMODS and SLOG-associating 2TM effector domain 1